MIAILDIGKTNKKCFIINEDYQVLYEKSTQLPEALDEAGDPCEDLELLHSWIEYTLQELLQFEKFPIRALNVATYGASLLHLDATGRAITPLYNYLKPFPAALQQQWQATYGDPGKLALETASPILGSLNSGWQLYRIKQHNPLLFNQISHSAHLPQYIAWRCLAQIQARLPEAPPPAEITSIGCHTMLWDFLQNDYHYWAKTAGIAAKFAPIQATTTVHNPQAAGLKIGIGIHDSSAALIPYLACFKEPFVLISTGTWCISLNPFNQEPLSTAALEQDCLCYLSYTGKPVKAARFFGGHEHDLMVQQLAEAFGVSADFYRTEQLAAYPGLSHQYLVFMRQLVAKQVASTKLVIGHSPVCSIFVDGGFSKNETFMALLAASFPEMEVYAASVPQATAIGAAMAIHNAWNDKTLPRDLFLMKKYLP